MSILISLLITPLFLLMVLSVYVVLTLFFIGVILEAIKAFNEVCGDTIAYLRDKIIGLFKKFTIDKSQDL